MGTGTCCPQSTRPQQGRVTGQHSDVQDGAGASPLHPHRPVPAGTQSLGARGQEEEQERILGSRLFPELLPCMERYLVALQLLCCGGQMWYPLLAVPSSGYFWQLQHSPVPGWRWLPALGSPLGAQRGHRRGVSGSWARSTGSPAPRKAINMPSANGAVMGAQRLIGTGINI